jgi:hypothetical protein
MKSTQMCPSCGASLDLSFGHAVEPEDFADFWASHAAHQETSAHQRSAAADPLRVERPPLKSAVSVLIAGADASTPLISGVSSIVVHAVSDDGSSLCHRVPAQALLRVDDGLWSSVPGYERCLECAALS